MLQQPVDGLLRNLCTKSNSAPNVNLLGSSIVRVSIRPTDVLPSAVLVHLDERDAVLVSRRAHQVEAVPLELCTTTWFR